MHLRSIFIFLIIFSGMLSQAQPFDAGLFDSMKWRMIGPHRGGRTVGAVGVAQQPNVFYIGVNNGGVWKTTDYGRTWQPIFDDQPTGSIGDVVVAPSNPNVIYVGSGEGIQRPDLSVGDGIYKSTDGGVSWKNMGLRDAQQIGGLAIDPNNENRLFVAALGHPYGPNTERGIFRSLDGGANWEKVLYKDENTGAVQVAIDPKNTNHVYAVLWAARQGPWENGAWQGPESGLYKSTDGGTTWLQLTTGLPNVKQGLGRIGLAIAPSDPNRLYATVDAGEGYAGIYRSVDAGNSWIKVSNDYRLWGRGSDFAELKVHPQNPNIVYVANIAAWKSEDGGLTWTGIRGAPGGDDYHRIWINPLNPQIILYATDQGAIITVNGGQTYSSWYNQPTAQFYHVSTDNEFPYNVYGGQQESGSVGISSRGNDGQITFREWHPVGVEEYGYVAVDPKDPNIIYGGKITRYDKRTGQTQNIAPEAVRSGKYRFLRTCPVLFSPKDSKTLYFAGNVLFKTQNGGTSWEVISPDLSRESWDIPESVGMYRAEEMKSMPRRGVIYAIAPSPMEENTIWAGTDDGLIHITRDGGKNWANITPPEITSWSKISQIDAGHFNANTAYVAVNRIRCSDMRPHIYRTHDGGKTWKRAVTGLPNEPINAVREDPVRPGLLYAGSENAVYVSFDDGDHWQSLRLNMPATSIRDLVIKDDDLVVGTHGRSFWILDDITPLRQLKPEIAVSPYLFAPQQAWRVRNNMNTDTPLPQEEPSGQNPPEGAILNYYLDKPADHVRLEVLDAKGKIIRTYRSDDIPYDIPQVNFPTYWIQSQRVLPKSAGSHRFCWDLRYDPLDVTASYPISAVFGQTIPRPTAPFVMPGIYTVRLTVDGKVFTQPLTVKMDPRVKTGMDQLQVQADVSLMCYENRKNILEASKAIASIRKQISDIMPTTGKKLQVSLQAMDKSLSILVDSDNFPRLQNAFTSVFNILQESDMPPTTQALKAAEEAERAYALNWSRWQALKDKELYALNAALTKSRVPAITIPTAKQPFPSPNSHPIAQDPGFKPLFLPDLSNARYPKDVWSISGDEITASEDQSIWTDRTYKDFILDLEFKNAVGTNSGVILRCDNIDNWIPNSVEIQIADDFAPQWANSPANWRCAAVFGHQAAYASKVKAPGEWNRMTITCKGRDIWIVLNGELVNHVNLNRWTSAKINPDGSAIPAWLSKPKAELPAEGYIGFQGKHAGAPVWFRNIRIKVLE